MAAPDFTFGRFLNRGDIIGFEALEKQDGGAFFQPLTFWSGLRKLKVNNQAKGTNSCDQVKSYANFQIPLNRISG